MTMDSRTSHAHAEPPARAPLAPEDEDVTRAGQKPKRSPARWVLLVVGLGAVGAFVAYRAKHPAASAPGTTTPTDRPVPVTVATVVQKDVPIWLEGLGTATPIATVNVKTLVDGTLMTVGFKEGQMVHKGDLLAQIDPRPYDIALHNAEAALARDSALLRDDRLNLERYRQLRSQNLIAQQQVDDQQALADQVEATTHADQAAIESAKLNLVYAHITSPIDGITGVRLVDPGNIVHAADTTYIVVITQLDPMTVLFTLPEDDLPRVQEMFAKGPIPTEAYSRDGNTKLATGTLALIDNEVNTTTATIRLRSYFPNKDRSLWPSEFVKARILLSTKKDAIVAPATAVQRGPNGTFVYAVGADDTVSVKPVDVELTQGDTAIFSKGLAVGDRVVTDGQNQLRPGSKISARDAKPVNPSAPPGAAASGASSSSPPPPDAPSPNKNGTAKPAGSAP
jgi:multidrug efflux system membrane fusion protein